MHPIRFHRGLAAPAAALLVALAVPGCHHRAPLEPVGATRAERPNETGANVLERDEMLRGATSMAELLDGRIPGVVLRYSGGRPWVEIRGQSTFNGSNEALIVIDGIQANARGLLLLNPADVHRIQVLKGASAAMYGIRGGNGVLVITTRREGE